MKSPHDESLLEPSNRIGRALASWRSLVGGLDRRIYYLLPMGKARPGDISVPRLDRSFLRWYDLYMHFLCRLNLH